MRHKRNEHALSAIRITGGILPPDFLANVVTQKAGKQNPEDYYISKSLNMKDEISRYWRIANDLYSNYKEKIQLAINEKQNISEKLLISLLRDVMGYNDIHNTIDNYVKDRIFQFTHVCCDDKVPVLLTNDNFELDKSYSIFGEENRKRSPHGLIQEFINAEANCTWGLVANGSKIRLLRENPSLTKPSFLEVDLELMFEDQLYSDFVAMWLTLHSSRLNHLDNNGTPILDLWRQEANDIGQRALEHLRDGVSNAIRELGNGFLEHIENTELRRLISKGQITPSHFYQELLNLIYRFLFLLTAEDRNLLFHPDATDEQKNIYVSGYSISRLREYAIRNRFYDQHSDLWESVLILFNGLLMGAKPLGIPALGGLFSSEHCPNLDLTKLNNKRLLMAIRSLSFFITKSGLIRINYRDMDTEELGSVYESLLEVHPFIDVESTPWKFGFLSDLENSSNRGTERKLTGSYYTPSSLVNELIKSTLEPVMFEAIANNPDDPINALLELKIIDPACGSGHFLLAAARRMAVEVARIHSGVDLPDERIRQQALRKVAQHCIYGVDKNQLSVELCRTALWIETIEPGKPLTFLDSHIQQGDSLVGLISPQILELGIQNDAYEALSGDDKQVCNKLKKRNRGGNTSSVQYTFADYMNKSIDNDKNFKSIHDLPEETINDVEAKKALWRDLENNNAREKFKADLYMAAYFTSKTKENEDSIPTNDDLERVNLDMTLRGGLKEYIEDLSCKFNFFHWYLAFPGVMEKGGFDVILGNPPWERVKLQEQEFFASRSPEIANAQNKAKRDELIKGLTSPRASIAEKQLYQEFLDTKRYAEAVSLFIRKSGRFPLTGVGDINTYAVFAETFLKLLSQGGRAGLIVPTGISTDNSTKMYFEEITSNNRLVSLYDFENREGIFQGVHRSFKFCLLTLSDNITESEFVFFATNVQHIQEEKRKFKLSPSDIKNINPNTKTCPIFRSKNDAELTKKIYARVPILINENCHEGNPWDINFMTMFHMSNDSHLFYNTKDLIIENGNETGLIKLGQDNLMPLYEAKMIHQYDSQWATFELDGESLRDVTQIEKKDPYFYPIPRYWVKESEVENKLEDKNWPYNWFIGFRDIARATDERTLISTVFPKSAVSNKLPLILAQPKDKKLYLVLLANLSSMVLDYVVRQKVGGTTLNFFYVKQFPVLSPYMYTQDDIDFISQRVIELTYSCISLSGFAEDFNYFNEPYEWDEERRAILKAELDAYFAKLYGLNKNELRYILDPTEVYGEDFPSETFRVLKSNEINQYGEYRTQRLIIEAWDRLFS